MANRRFDNDNVYFELWGMTLQFDRISYTIQQLSDVLESRIKNDSLTINNTRETSKPFEVNYSNGKEVNSIVPCAWKNIGYTEEAISTVGKTVDSVLRNLGFNISPNWERISVKWLDELKKIEKIWGDATGKATEAALQKQVIKYQQVYNEELAKDYGLGFGIISSSIINHMVYAAQSASKEQKDHKRAEKAAEEATKNSASEITVQVYEIMYPMYIEKIEPALIKLLSEYYAYIVAIFAKELGCSFDEVKALYDIDKSNEYLIHSASDARGAILHSLQKNPDNGSVIGYAITKGILDDDLCAYGALASESFQYRVKEWAITTLSKIHESSQMFNKALVNTENSGIIKGLQIYYRALNDNISDPKCDWQNVIKDVYGDIFSKVGATFSQLTMGCRNNGDNDYIANCVKTNKRIAISDTDKKLFLIGCNELQETHCTQIAKSLKLNFPVAIEQIERIVESLNNIITQLYHKQEQANRERREANLKREQEIAEQKRKEQEQQKRTIKRISIIALSLTIVIITGYFMYDRVIYPSSQYDEATKLMNAGEYEEAISVFKVLNGYSDSLNQIKKCENEIINAGVQLLNIKNYAEAYSVLKKYETNATACSKLNECICLWVDDAFSSSNTTMALSFKNTVDLSSNQYASVFQKISKKISDNNNFEYWNDNKNNTHNAEIVYLLLQTLPTDYDSSISSYLIFFDACVNGKVLSINDYLNENYKLISDLWVFDFVKNAVMTDDATFQAYLYGNWYTPDETYYFKLTKKDPYTINSSYTLPSEKVDYLPNFLIKSFVYSRIYGLYQEGEEVKDIFKFTIIDGKQMDVFCYKNGKTYTLVRK